MSVKKSMLIIWAVASLLWVSFSAYMFRLNEIGYIYSKHEHFAEKVAQGRRAHPTRWGYYYRNYKKTAKQAEEANRDLTLFLLIGIGFPGLMLSIGTALLENIDKPKSKKPRKKQ